MQAEEAVERLRDDSVSEAPSLSPATIDIKEEEKTEIVDNVKDEPPSADDACLKGTALLKSLLSTSTASAVLEAEKMITTTEVTDEKLNLKKILYQPDNKRKEEKELESPTLNGQNIHTIDTHNDDDDRRLVIDISDDEKDGTDRLKMNGKSMPSLNNMSNEDDNNNARKMMRLTSLETTVSVPLKNLTRHIRTQHSE